MSVSYLTLLTNYPIKGMVSIYNFKLFCLILIAGLNIILPQGRAVHQKPSPSKEKTEYHKYVDEAAKSGNPYYSSSNREVYSETGKEEKYEKIFTNYTCNSDNYFRIDDNKNSLWNGKHWQFSDFPLKVYIKNLSLKKFEKKFKGYIDYALEIWEAADQKIKFLYTKSLSDADIIISFEDNLMEKYNENYLGLTEYDLDEDRKITHSYIEISLLKFNNQIVSDGEIKVTIIHEFGHALGLGHSNNHADLMYPYISKNSSDKLTYIELSTGDIEAVSSAINLGTISK